MEQMEKLQVLLPHWIDHNRGHALECGKWSQAARQSGNGLVADHIDAAIAAMNQASDHLAQALQAAGGSLHDPGPHGHHHHHHG